MIFPLLTLVSSLHAAAPVTAVLTFPAADEPPPFAASLGGETLPPVPLEVEGALKKNFDFWVSVYSRYYTYQGLVHDTKYVDKVYEVMDFHHRSGPQGRHVIRAKKKWRELLLKLHRESRKPGFDPTKLAGDEKRLFDLYADVGEPDKFLNASHRRRLRFQLGQKDRFIQGAIDAGRYLPHMEAIFRREGLPPELTRLPFVESSFNIRARSKVGASGIWQFMPSTGKLFLRIDDAVDERNDPLLATEAAAKLLRLNYESLKSWPLAVTAYNHGRKGMMRAVRKVGSDDLGDLIAGYRSRSFGFASSNFFVELVASIRIEREAQLYLGQIEREKALTFFEVPLPDYIGAKRLAQFLHVDLKVLREYNPALTPAVFSGQRLIPAGYRLRLPQPAGVQPDSAARVFLAGYQAIPTAFKLKSQTKARYVQKKYGRRSRRR
jgi:membrane-bound lytic murein transglycosylase D